METIIELGLGIALLLGIYQRVVAWSSAALLMSFALTMSIALGITAPLSYSVFTALGAALLLGAVAVPQAARSSARTAICGWDSIHRDAVQGTHSAGLNCISPDASGNGV